jgi:hypothetical protein
VKSKWQSPGLATALEAAGLARAEATSKLMDEQAANPPAEAGKIEQDERTEK